MMLNPQTHICLISAQPVPNLIPAVDRKMQPRRIIQVVSPDMEARARLLKDVLKGRGIRVEQWSVDDAWDIEHLQQRMLELIEREFEIVPDGGIALNATGGTKLMSLAAYESCRLYKMPIFYVHPEKDRIIWLYPEKRAAIDLDDRLKLDPFLQAHGARVSQEKPPQRNIPDKRYLEVAHEIIASIERFSQSLRTLNWLAGSASKQLISDELRNDRGPLAELIDQFESHDFLRRDSGCLRFPDEEARFFVNGGWLEYLVFDAVRQIRQHDPHIQDIARSVNVERQRDKKSVRNELDVAFLRNNRLHIIECKTRQFKGQDEDSHGAGTLYKLKSLKELMGGLQARTMVVTFHDFKTADHSRAKEMGIAVCAGTQLKDLQTHLQDFISA